LKGIAPPLPKKTHPIGVVNILDAPVDPEGVVMGEQPLVVQLFHFGLKSKLRYGMVWCGVEWVVWSGVAWRGVVWCSVAWCGVV